MGYSPVVESLSHVWPSATPWTAACQALLSSSISQSLLRFMSVELVMLSNHLILCFPLLLLPSVFTSIRVFSNELALHIRWPKYQSFSFSTPSNEYSGLIIQYSFIYFIGQIFSALEALFLGPLSLWHTSTFVWVPSSLHLSCSESSFIFLF